MFTKRKWAKKEADFVADGDEEEAGLEGGGDGLRGSSHSSPVVKSSRGHCRHRGQKKGGDRSRSPHSPASRTGGAKQEFLRRSTRVPRPPQCLTEKDVSMEGDSAEENGAVSEGETIPSHSPDMNSRGGPSGGHSRSHCSHRGGTFRSHLPPSLTSRAWRTEEDPDVAPPKLKFIPRRTPGIQAPLNIGTHTPLDIFSCFFDAEVLSLLCSSTNKRAFRHLERGTKYQWMDITPEELKKFIGLLLYMGVMNLPKMTDYWRKQTIFEVPFPATVMPRDRFKSILSFFCISDSAEDVHNDLARGTEDYDLLHHVQPLFDMLRTRCMAVYHPRQHISVHERMVATKARLSLKQYMRDRAIKWGLKFFVLADNNGYTVDYQLYTGKSKSQGSVNGLSFDVVSSLVNKDYLGSGYIVYCDKFYTSPQLFRHLGQQGFGACGTYRQGRIGVPTSPENALTKRSPRGSIRWLRDGDLLFVKWMDTKEVSMCTNVHSVFTGETVLRWTKKADGTCEQVPIPRPTAVGEYNRYMGGVDTSDQLLKTNTAHRKMRRWYITVFQHMLDIAVTNSFIISKELSTIRGERPPTRQDFQEKLTSQLLGVALKTQPKGPASNHLPVPTSYGQSKSQRASLGRRQCVLCRRCTPWQCEECDMGLCMQLDRNCFRMYHTTNFVN